MFNLQSLSSSRSRFSLVLCGKLSLRFASRATLAVTADGNPPSSELFTHPVPSRLSTVEFTGEFEAYFTSMGPKNTRILDLKIQKLFRIEFTQIIHYKTLSFDNLYRPIGPRRLHANVIYIYRVTIKEIDTFNVVLKRNY